MGPMLPPVSPAQAKWASESWPGMDAVQLDAARTLYVARCTSCHSAVLPAELSIPKWQKMLDKMAPKAKLTPEQKELIWRYVVTVHDAPAD